MLPSELKKAISSLQSAIDSQEKVSLAFFADKLHKTAEIHPYDQTIGQMSLVVDRMNAGNRIFISRAEVKDLYNKLYSRNTKFAQLFSDEMGLENQSAEPVVSATEESYKEFDIYQDTDKTLLAGLTSAFDPTATVYSTEIAKEAENTVALECAYPGLVPTVKAISGDANCVVVQASYPTSKGAATFYVPVEMDGKNASTPSYFMGRDGSHYISKVSIAKYVDSFFSKAGSFGNSEVGEALVEVLEPEVSSSAVESFASQLSTAKGIASYQHGDKVEQGRNIIAARLNSFGKRSAQIKVLDASSDSITYGVKCDGVAFKVPVKIESGRLMEPNIILCKGSIESFSADGIGQLELADQTDNQVAALVSPVFDLKPSELVEVVREAAASENYAKAEDALNVLQNSGDEQAYRVAFIEFANALGGVKKESEVSNCSRVIKTANSNQPVCSHLNLPVDKVYQDKNGDCRPLSRKAHNDIYEGAVFMNSKIFQ